MGYRYVVLGAGAQGVAAAYDLARFGDAEMVVLADMNEQKAIDGATRVGMLKESRVVLTPICLDAANTQSLMELFERVRPHAVISAISFTLNESLTDIAISFGAHMCDLGGNTRVVRAQHKRDARARAADVSIVPDCGMGPGLNLSLAHSALSAMARPEKLTIYCGGLPQKPEGELQYTLCFSMGGLVNEYSGHADVLQGGKLKKRPCLGDVEELTLHLGVLEASYTSGGLSTAPWSYKKEFPTLQDLVYKTLRYPGHWEQLRKFRKAGRLQEELEMRLGTVPQEFSDMGIIIVRGDGHDASGRPVHVFRSIVDLYDPESRFTAMQRLTGFHVSIMTILAVQGKIPRGVVPVELVSGDMVITEMHKRGIVTEGI